MNLSDTFPPLEAPAPAAVRPWSFPDHARPVPDRRATFAVMLVGTLLSLALSGYAAGEENNYYQMPILAGLYHEPQFATDPFIQSLRFYASGFWQMLSGSANGPHVYTILFAFQILSRMILVFSIMEWATLLECGSVMEVATFTALVLLSSTIRGFSNAGVGGLLISSFTHSEMANGTMLLALVWAGRGRITASLAVNGVTFFLNAFVGVWTLVPLVFIIWSHWRHHGVAGRTLARQAAWGVGILAAFAAPVVHNILANPYTREAPSFDYVGFLQSFFPYHFLIWSTSHREQGLLAVIFCCGLATASMLPTSRAALKAALWGAASVWIAGVFLPFLSHSRLLLNLHLLRSGSTVHMLSAIAVAALATRWVFSGTASDRLVWAPLLFVLSCTLKIFMPLVLVLLVVRRWRPAVAVGLRRYAAPALLLAGVAFNVALIYRAAVSSRVAVQKRDDWQALGTWARAHTAVDALFLNPPGISWGMGMSAKNDAFQDGLSEGAPVFTYFSHRQSWVSSPAGAAVMWAPAYYPTWHARITEVRALKTLPDRLDYAARNGIAYVVDGCARTDPRPPLARFGRLCLFSSRSTQS
ncbi:conserved hypothetical protein [Gluconacetobacter diazotrophicus PA1 5]|uniref:hypothetical protein n=1 Tax=Gluconacetobacter diazotrophicus TaxID=33996 RepID=UPI000173AEAE|nr:hypothetical protein [Gluconacetobacter diazotrophicus]ACI50545.1 conserved hypothetical protein [Gluconacetobacter diazotrophicus PA1 5]TWB09377.1 hypothetical protein FBZ86_10439 [Gluconacetobacter diazotrophicus]